ncbi:carbohydrate ABC transporter membrane protein 1 (CUT1 family) [Sediminihabitans luteus]|uniref:Carbohydrate ABC transporter membrane protein 1 (CUT1 family) n=1 Tax=Sediminihabitans luteus TaxID=1138585 RepID=A0A2M9D1B8_9CELL|nr:sugar ABC transporter permease [Sediminihabitans luteus]PJJ77960.1 carbohydrate ABC transporter membrane protein 1 (CUT1 family) [Sediminihabitans luteus]GIJ00589.1 bicyclomycin resistance protein [Sediminihabitans luteus]
MSRTETPAGPTQVLPAPVRPPKRTHSPAERKLRRSGWLMVLPALLHIGLWTAIPVVATFALGFTDYNVFSPPRWIGLDNYVEIVQDPVFRKATWNTIQYTFWTVPVSMFIALVIAVALNQGLRLQKWYRTAFFLPQVTATVAIAMVWLWIFNPQQGLLNAFLGVFGIPGQAWLADPDWALWSVILVGAWQGIGIKMLIYIAALQNVDESLYEAASVDGASTVRKFFAITVPMLKPATFFVLVISIINAFQVFDQIYVLTDGGPANATTMMTYEVYRSAFEEFRMGMASAQSVVLFFFLLFMTLVGRRATREDS